VAFCCIAERHSAAGRNDQAAPMKSAVDMFEVWSPGLLPVERQHSQASKIFNGFMFSCAPPSEDVDSIPQRGVDAVIGNRNNEDVSSPRLSEV
jgi:hypothetical protein